MDVEARMEIIDQDLKLLKTIQSQSRSRDVSREHSIQIKTLEKELVLLDIIKKIDLELERFKVLDELPVAGSIDNATDNLKRAREKLVGEQMALARKTRCSSLHCSSMNIKDAMRKLEALDRNYSDNLLTDTHMRNAIQYLKSGDRDVWLLLTQTKALDGMTKWCFSKMESFYDKFLKR